jgi:molybdopterin molybdotransferase
LAEAIHARRTQPPFDASSMDGYAVIAADTGPGVTLTLIGEAAAGRAFAGRVGTGETVRIFTGAPVPDGADAVIMQEDVERDGTRVTLSAAVTAGRFVRRAGLDFETGRPLLAAGTRLDFRTVSLAAAANHPTLPVVRQPLVAIIATGDELVSPGETPGPDQIVASNGFGVAALVERLGGRVLDLGIVPDNNEAIARRVGDAIAAKADILVTLGGASVGDHDLVQATLGAQGMELGFWKIAMRPGKPLMFGHLGPMRVVGLPGNPVSSLVCAILFLEPLVNALGGRGAATREPRMIALAAAMPANDQREDYVRARLESAADGGARVRPFALQDSSMLSVLAQADGLIVRAPHAKAAEAGECVPFLPFEA